MSVKNLAEQYNIIIMTPEGEEPSWYINSPRKTINLFPKKNKKLVNSENLIPYVMEKI